ncbi:MAG: gliding motility-associated-like protein [Flavobacteriales bacterium]|jgi:gliding motility-associated-like protein
MSFFQCILRPLNNEAKQPFGCFSCLLFKTLQKMKKLITFLMFVTLCVPGTYAQVVINEFSSSNYTDFNTGGEFEDWVELYNPTGAAIDIGGFFLSDLDDELDKFEIPGGTMVPANGFLVVLCSGMFDVNPNAFGYLNTDYKVIQAHDEGYYFSDPGLTPISAFKYNTDGESNYTNQSWGHSVDGGNDWVIFADPTPGGTNSTAAYAGYSSKVQFDMASGYYAGALSVTLTADANTTIYYTLNGNEPTDGATQYAGPIAVNATTVMKAIAYDNGGAFLPSKVETNTYFLGADQHTIPVVSLSGNTVGDGAWAGDEYCAIEFFNADGSLWCESNGDSNEHGNDSNAYDQRGFDYVTRDAMGQAHELEEQLFHAKSRDRYQRLIFKAAANDNYPFTGGGSGAHIRDAYVQTLSHNADLHLDERTNESCIVYLNGQYWGVYEYREKVDDLDFTREYYDQPRHFVDFLKTWGGTWSEYGDIGDWNTFVNFVTTQDMTDPANFDYVESVYNTMSLIDYFILNSYIVSADWLNWNTAWWRGRHPDGDAKRWRYVLWDMDNSFGQGANYTGIPDQSANADPCDPDDLGDPGGQGHVPILNALLENEDFFADYINRYASLSNSYLNCEYMHFTLDSMINVIAPEMQRHCERWGGTVASWESQVEILGDFIDARCDGSTINGIEDCYDVEAVTLTIIIEGVGEVEIEDFDISGDMVPWDGTYFAELPIDLFADDLGQGIFLYWEVTSGTLVIPDPENPELNITLTEDVTITAYFLNDFDPKEIMFDVQPVGGGDILFADVPMGPYPNTVLVDAGLSDIEAVGTDIWFEFDHWEILNGTINPDDTDPVGTVFVGQTDTIIAVFNELPNFDIVVDVEPAGAGWITMDGVDLVNYPWVETVAGEVDVNFITGGVDVWSVFSHWELSNHTVLPDDLSQDMIVNLTANDTIIAVYTIVPHNTITVIVEPAIAGSVLVDNTLIVNNDWTGELEGDIATPFTAFAEAFWYFDRWEALNHLPAPDNRSQEVDFTFNTSDTIVAYFVEEPFNVFVPNSFTPNNDGKNDVFLPVGSAWDLEYYELLIFNRWGEVVFQSADASVAWTGDHQSGTHYVRDEVYVYRLKVKSVHEVTPSEYSGSITVIR